MAHAIQNQKANRTIGQLPNVNPGPNNPQRSLIDGVEPENTDGLIV
jgi:hypothetical protein